LYYYTADSIFTEVVAVFFSQGEIPGTSSADGGGDTFNVKNDGLGGDTVLRTGGMTSVTIQKPQ